MSTKTISSIDRLVTLDNQPAIGKNLLIMDVKLRIKQLTLNSKKDFLTTCLSKSLVTPEIISIAKKVVSETSSNKRQIKEEKRILRYRIREKIGQIADCNENITKHMKNIHKNLNMSQRAINEFKTVWKEELNAKWAALKNRGKKEKIRKMKSSQPKQNIPYEIGVVICDDKLNDMFEDDIPKVAIYGDIQPTKEIIDFLNIPTGFRTYTKMSKLNEEVRNEEAATHERWRFMFNLDDSQEEMRKMRDHENRMRMVYNDQKICFSNLRAMDFS